MIPFFVMHKLSLDSVDSSVRTSGEFSITPRDSQVEEGEGQTKDGGWPIRCEQQRLY